MGAYLSIKAAFTGVTEFAIIFTYFQRPMVASKSATQQKNTTNLNMVFKWGFMCASLPFVIMASTLTKMGRASQTSKS